MTRRYHQRFALLLIGMLLFTSCEEGVPFPYLPIQPTGYNLNTTYADKMSGPVSMFTCEVFQEYYDGLVSQTVACFDTAGHCLDYYYRDREECLHSTFVYDSIGRRIEHRCYRDTAGTSFDSLDQLFTHTDYSYSRNGRRCKARITGPDGKRHTFRLRFDDSGHLTKYIFPDGSRMSYKYDTCGRLVERMYPDASTERFEYSSSGNLTTYVDRDGVYNWYAPNAPQVRYDSLGRVVEELVSRDDRDGGPVLTTYSYDDHGNWVRHTTTGSHIPSTLEVRTFKYYN